ncbi:MAG TPA: hypothetical protein VN924_14745 [Bryobacteraceae bacterium]|jgi:hypothetical protein|nr:hypothetical protein [Bryobacteraceae bacterium]
MVAGREYVNIPGNKTHELPPLLVRGVSSGPEVDLASAILEAEEMLPEVDVEETLLERRKMDLALTLAEQYRGLIAHWHWGESIVEWIRQCEITFQSESSLRDLLHPDVWPHASRSSFVMLLVDKNVRTPGVALETAVGLRLTFRQPPPINCCSGEFLFCLNSPIAGSAYKAWSHMGAGMPALLPPDRFHFDVFDSDLQ